MYCTYKLLLLLLVLYRQESFCTVPIIIIMTSSIIHFGGSLECWINEWMNELQQQQQKLWVIIKEEKPCQVVTNGNGHW